MIAVWNSQSTPASEVRRLVYTERGLGNPKWKSREFAAAFSAVIVLGLGPRVTLAKAPKGSARESNAAKRAQIREGASLFRGNCSPCHGLYAQGGGRGPDLSSGRWVHGSTDADIFHTITQGVPGTEMPANSFEDSEIRALIAYLRSLRPSSKPAASAPERGTHDGCASSAGMPFPTPWLARSAPAHPRAVASLVAQRLHERSARAGSMHAVLRVPPPPRAAFAPPRPPACNRSPRRSPLAGTWRASSVRGAGPQYTVEAFRPEVSANIRSTIHHRCSCYGSVHRATSAAPPCECAAA